MLLTKYAMPIELPPKYYLDYFLFVLQFVQDKYRHILVETEWRFLRKFYCLSENSQCLFIRFCNRKGLFFRTSKLKYTEIEIKSALEELQEAGFLHLLDIQHQIYFAEILDIFKKEELVVFSVAEVPELNVVETKKTLKALSKPELTVHLLEFQDFELFIAQIKEHIIQVSFDEEVGFFKFLFFGNRYMDMTEFVMRDIGIRQFERIAEEHLVPRFTTRKEAEDKLFISIQREIFEEMSQQNTPLEIYNWFLVFVDSTKDLSEIALPSYQRFILKIAKFLEKNKCLEQALNIYQLTEDVPSRERQVRLLQKMKYQSEALALCQQILESSKNADEYFFANDFIQKNESKKSKKSTTKFLQESESITVSLDWKNQVEMGAVNYYLSRGEDAVFSENIFWRALFGLTFWDIIFDKQYASFHHPLQRRPSDLALPDFYLKRKTAIEKQLNDLEDTATCLKTLSERFTQKYNIANPYVFWSEETWFLLRKALERIELDKLKAVLLEMAQNITENTRGFPDLFVWTENDYCFVEIKSPTDSLSNQQLYWLQFFEKIGINAKVIRVEWGLTKSL